MNSYNRMIASELNKNVERYLETNPQPHALSTGLLYGGKRVRDHPQCGHTAYSTDPATLVPDDGNLMLDEHMEGGKKYGVSRFVKDLGKISKAIGIKQITKPLTKALVNKGVSEIAGAGFDEDEYTMEGGKKKYGVSRFVKDLNKISHAIGLKQITKPLTKALVNKGVAKIEGAGRGRGRPRKVVDESEYDEYAGFGDLEGGKKKYGVSRFVKDLGKISKAIGIKQITKPLTKALVNKGVSEIEGAGRRPRGRPRKMTGGASELYPPSVARGGKRGSTARGELIKKVMREQGLNLGQASKYIKENGLF